MSDIEVLSQLSPVLGEPPSDTTVRRTLELADKRALARAATARKRARARAWELIEARPGGLPWLQVAGKPLPGWLVIGLDATLVTARPDKEGAAPTWKKGQADPEDQPRLAMEERVPDLLATAHRPARTSLTSTTSPATGKEDHPGAVGVGAARRHRAD